MLNEKVAIITGSGRGIGAATTLRFGGSFHWESQEGVGTFCCPDPKIVNVFRLERVKPSKRDE